MVSRKPNDVFHNEKQSQLVILVVPCYNEENRWVAEYWERLSRTKDLKLLFVNDGSTDGTSFKIGRLIENSHHALLELPNNVGKAEAIRFGFQTAFAEEPLGIGFLDADGAFPLDDVKIQIGVFRKLYKFGSPPISIWSSRVQLAGRSIERKALRHYFARVLVTLLALRLNFRIYDTQSGLKIFPFTPMLVACTNEEFKTRWFIDLELFLRWRIIANKEMIIWEEPLLGWKDVEESKLSGKQYLAILKDIKELNKYKTNA